MLKLIKKGVKIKIIGCSKKPKFDISMLKTVDISEIPATINELSSFTFYKRLENAMQQKYYICIHFLHTQNNIKGYILEIDKHECTTTILSEDNEVYHVKLNQITRLMWKKSKNDIGKKWNNNLKKIVKVKYIKS